MNSLSKIFLTSLISLFFLVGCGVSPADQAKAMRSISNYSAHGDNPPAIDKYEDAGLKGVNSRNIGLINSFINNADYDDVDTKEEIQSKVIILRKIQSLSFMGADKDGAPTKDDYLALGIKNIEKASDKDIVNVNRTIALNKRGDDYPKLLKIVEELAAFFSHKKK